MNRHNTDTAQSRPRCAIEQSDKISFYCADQKGTLATCQYSTSYC